MQTMFSKVVCVLAVAACATSMAVFRPPNCPELIAEAKVLPVCNAFPHSSYIWATSHAIRQRRARPGRLAEDTAIARGRWFQNRVAALWRAGSDRSGQRQPDGREHVPEYDREEAG